VSTRSRFKSAIFVATSLSIALAVLLGLGCHRERGPALIETDTQMTFGPQPTPLEAGRDKGVPGFAAGIDPPPAVGSVPSLGDKAISPPYQHDGARIDHSLTTGVTGTDPKQGTR
jgi:hypothetical protein